MSTGTDAPDAPEARDATSSTDAGRRILLVEDDPAVLDLTGRWLADGNHTVVTAVSAVDVLARVASAAIDLQAVDLVVTDVMMPGMTGPGLMGRLHAIRADLPVVYMSGFVGDVAADVLPAGAPLVRKPMTAEAFLDAVASALRPGQDT